MAESLDHVTHGTHLVPTMSQWSDDTHQDLLYIHANAHVASSQDLQQGYTWTDPEWLSSGPTKAGTPTESARSAVIGNVLWRVNEHDFVQGAFAMWLPVLLSHFG